jgi:hypothetical protein
MEVMAELFLPSHKLKMKAKETSWLQIMAHILLIDFSVLKRDYLGTVCFSFSSF